MQSMYYSLIALAVCCCRLLLLRSNLKAVREKAYHHERARIEGDIVTEVQRIVPLQSTLAWIRLLCCSPCP